MEKKHLVRTDTKMLLVLLVSLFPILDPYILSNQFSIALCDLVILFFTFLFIKKRERYIFAPLCYVLIIDLALSFLAFIFTNNPNLDIMLEIKVFINFLCYLIGFSYFWKLDIKELFFKVVVIVGTIAAILGILQFIFANLGWTSFFSGRLPFPLGKYNIFGGLLDGNTGRVRVHSFFEEPSYLAIYELPITAYCLRERKYVYALITGISCIISSSLLGIAGIFIIICYFVTIEEKISKKRKFMLAGAIIACLIMGLILYIVNENINSLVNYYLFRAKNMEFSRADSSASQRIFGNIKLFGKYKLFNKLIGVGINQYALFFNLSNDYSNDFVCTVLNFGIIGLTVLIIFLQSIYKNTNRKSKIFFILFVLVIAVDHSWFGPYFFYLLTWCVLEMKKTPNWSLKM